MQSECTMQASKGGRSLTALPSYDTYELQQCLAWLDNPKGRVVVCIPWHNQQDKLDSRLAQQEGNQAWLWKPSQKFNDSEVKIIGESTTTDLLNQCNP